MEWISVEEKLPNNGDRVFFVIDTTGYEWMKYPTNLIKGDFKRLERGWTFRDDMKPVNNSRVTHWAYIPEGPK